MNKVRIEICESELHKLDNYTLLTKVTPEVARSEKLHEFFSRSTDFSEIASCDQDEIVCTAERAIDESAKGIKIEIESGRDCRDHRCYTYISSEVTDGDYPDYTVVEMLEHLAREDA